MIILIHGDDLTLSRKTLENQKLKYENLEKINFNGDNVNLSDIVTTVSSLSLFGNQKLVILENFFQGILSHEKETIIDFVKKEGKSVKFIFWESKEIGKALIKKYFSEAEIFFCQIPPVLFKFLDSIGEKPLPTILSMFHKLSAVSEGEFILSMLIRQWRNLIIASDLGPKGFIDIPSWQSHKFIIQSRYFNLEKLIASYRQLLSLEVKVKKGNTPYLLNQLLDIFFISLYYQF